MRTSSENKISAFTLIELIVVIAVLAILAAIALPNFTGFIDRGRMSVDKASLATLNNVTEIYKVQNEIKDGDVFYGLSSDEQRMQLLVEEKLLSNIVEAKYKDAEFIWDIASQKWLYSLYLVTENRISRYLFSGMQLGEFIFNTWGGGGGRNWSINEKGLNVTGANGNDLIFLGNPRSEYTLTTNFKLNENPGQNGGVGIFFETVLNKDNQYRDSGYILQFDRGFSEIVIRKRVEGSESSSQGSEIIERIGNRSTSTIKNNSIPYKSDSSWWESEKQMLLSVKESGTPGKKLLTVILNGETILSNYEIESDIESVNNHTGFRAWNNASATISEMTID